jgi:SPX domain protein involved in polyphosphate accumulation
MKFIKEYGRRELKYFIVPELIPDIITMITPYVEVDPYAEGRDNNTYTIRSIYFDTEQYDFYYEKMDGVKIRKKIRVRSYNEYHPEGFAFLEIKRRYNNRIVKERSQVPLSQLEQVCIERTNPNGHIDVFSNGSVVMSKFLYNLTKMDLHPSVLVTYEREPYIGAMDNSIRVTFDKDVRAIIAPELQDLFTDDGFEFLTDGKCILELKFDGFMPKWMRYLVAELNIRVQSISKYCLGVEIYQKSC